MAKKQSTKATPAPAVKALDSDQLDLEELDYTLSKALGIAMALAALPGGDVHNSAAAAAITDYLHAAKKILAGEEARHV